MEEASLKSYPPLAPMDESSLDVNTSYAQILHFIEGSPKVVDFGCGPGNLARFLTQRGCTVFGVEINPDSAGLASEYCADVLIADLETASLLKLFPTERFDVAIFADILEHLRKPERLLAETTRILRPGGYVIASIPNIAHGAVRLAMMKGEFNYQEIGILDESHLRFFTRKTVETLFEGAGFSIEDIARTSAPIFEPSGTLIPAVDRADFTEEVTSKIEADAEAQTLQFIIKAVPASEKRGKTGALALRVRSLEQKLHAAEMELAKKRDEMTALSAREESSARREAKLAEENLEAAEAIAQLKKDVDEREVMIGTLRAELDVAAKTIRERAAELARLGDEISAASAREKSAKRRESQLRQRVARLQKQLESGKQDLLAALNTVDEQQMAIVALESRLEATQDDAAHAQTRERNLDTLYQSTESHRVQLSLEIEELRGEYVRLRHLTSAMDHEIRNAKEHYAEALGELDQARAAAAQLSARYERAEFYLEEMRNSKFWRFRNSWFRVKRAFGIVTDIP